MFETFLLITHCAKGLFFHGKNKQNMGSRARKLKKSGEFSDPPGTPM